MSIIGLFYVKDCNVSEVVDCLSLFPPYPQFCSLLSNPFTLDRVDCSDNGYSGRYGMDTTEKVIPSSIQINYVTVSDKYSICLFHFRVPNSPYDKPPPVKP